jgi:hypothetical protein
MDAVDVRWKYRMSLIDWKILGDTIYLSRAGVDDFRS